MSFHYQELMKPYRLSTVVTGFLHLTWYRVPPTSNGGKWHKKTAFRAGSTGLYKFTHMPFRFSNVGFSFCHLMEQCLRDQQFVTLLLYLNDICIFAPMIDDMLDQIKLVFDRLKQFNLKIKPKKCQFFNTSVLFLGHILSANGIPANPEKVEKVKTWPVPTNIKEVQSFLRLTSYYRQFINKFAEKAQCLHELVGPTSNKQKKKPELRRILLLM